MDRSAACESSVLSEKPARNGARPQPGAEKMRVCPQTERARMAEDLHVRRTVLVVDDHPGFRASVRELLAGGPFEVVAEAGDGLAALEAFGREHPDVVLLDIALPGPDGFAIAEALAAEKTPPAVVLISTRDASDYGPRIGVAPVRGFLQKGALSVTSLEVLLR